MKNRNNILRRIMIALPAGIIMALLSACADVGNTETFPENTQSEISTSAQTSEKSTETDEDGFASDDEALESAKNAVRNLDLFEGRILSNYVMNKSYSFDDYERGVLAAMSMKQYGSKTEKEYYAEYEISYDNYISALSDYFDNEDIELKSNPDNASIMDAYRFGDKCIIYIDEQEHESDFVLNDENISKINAQEYIYEREIFYGYWGSQDKSSNYKISYIIKANAESRYGCNIMLVKIDELMQTGTENEETEEEVYDESYNESYDGPFYGIWVYASKDEAEAARVADSIREQGFSGLVFDTTDWDGLSDEKWYAVAAEIFYSEYDAETSLDWIKTTYPDAYIKYSGARR